MKYRREVKRYRNKSLHLVIAACCVLVILVGLFFGLVNGSLGWLAAAAACLITAAINRRFINPAD